MLQAISRWGDQEAQGAYLCARWLTARRLCYLCPCHLLDLHLYLFGIVNHLLQVDDMQYWLLEFIRSSHVKEPMWTHLPQGFLSHRTSTCLCMKRSIYGLNYAPCLWWEHILKTLKELGLKLSQHDQCLF
jgi:hypothetical protein